MSGSIGPTGPTAPTAPITTHIASLDELLSSHTALVAKEADDTATLQQLVSVNRDSLRTTFIRMGFQWISKYLYCIINSTDFVSNLLGWSNS